MLIRRFWHYVMWNVFGIWIFQLSNSFKKTAINISFDVKTSPEHFATSWPSSILFINNNVFPIATATHNNSIKKNVKKSHYSSVYVFFTRLVARYWFHFGRNSVAPSADNSNPLASRFQNNRISNVLPNSWCRVVAPWVEAPSPVNEAYLMKCRQCFIYWAVQWQMFLKTFS